MELSVATLRANEMKTALPAASFAGTMIRLHLNGNGAVSGIKRFMRVIVIGIHLRRRGGDRVKVAS